MPRHSVSHFLQRDDNIILFRNNIPIKQLGSWDGCLNKLVNNRTFAGIKW